MKGIVTVAVFILIIAAALAACAGKDRAAVSDAPKETLEATLNPPPAEAMEAPSAEKTAAPSAAKIDAASIVQSRCTVCHGMEKAEEEKADAAGWTAIIKGMVAKGAKLNDAEIVAVAEYLAHRP